MQSKRAYNVFVWFVIFLLSLGSLFKQTQQQHEQTETHTIHVTGRALLLRLALRPLRLCGLALRLARLGLGRLAAPSV